MVTVSEAILDSIGEGLIAIDKNKKIMIVNKAAEEMLGWKMKDLLRQEVGQIPIEDEKGKRLSIQKRPLVLVLSGEKIVSNRYSYVRKDETKIPVAFTASPVIFGGKIIGAVAVFRDITEEKKIDKTKSEFIYIASHGLTTPLSVAKLYLEALQKNQYFKDAPEKIKDYIHEIYKSNRRSITLVRSLLSVSRIDQGRVSDSPEMIDVSALTKKIVNEMKTIAEKNKINISFKQKQRDLSEIYIDPQRLREVLENLISNAIKYNVPKGKVAIIVERDADFIHFRVEDTGIGIAKKDQKNLFTKFFRTEKGAITNADGTGLGLYVAKSYIEGWGGTLSVESDEGKGTTISFAIPLKQKK